MKVTLKFLEEQDACSEGVAFVTEHKLIGLQGKEFVKQLMKLDKMDWANWLIVRVMKRKECLSYAIYAAEQVIGIYEKQYPDDKRPRLAIDAAKKVLKKDTKENRDAAWAAADAYDAASAAAWAAADAYDAAYAAAYAAYAASAAVARKEMKVRILTYAIGLL